MGRGSSTKALDGKDTAGSAKVQHIVFGLLATYLHVLFV